MLLCSPVVPRNLVLTKPIVMQAIRRDIRCQQHMAAAVSQSRATFTISKSHADRSKV